MELSGHPYHPEVAKAKSTSVPKHPVVHAGRVNARQPRREASLPDALQHCWTLD